jgi:hypothetical protein
MSWEDYREGRDRLDTIFKRIEKRDGRKPLSVKLGDNHNAGYAMDVSSYRASALMQSLLVGQRDLWDPKYVISRKGRTQGTIWYADRGGRPESVHRLAGTVLDDMQVKFDRAFAPDLRVVKVMNPKLAKEVDHLLRVIGNGLAAMRAELNGKA